MSCLPKALVRTLIFYFVQAPFPRARLGFHSNGYADSESKQKLETEIDCRVTQTMIGGNDHLSRRSLDSRGGS
jgi:hypothetical protein